MSNSAWSSSGLSEQVGKIDLILLFQETWQEPRASITAWSLLASSFYIPQTRAALQHLMTSECQQFKVFMCLPATFSFFCYSCWVVSAKSKMLMKAFVEDRSMHFKFVVLNFFNNYIYFLIYFNQSIRYILSTIFLWRRPIWLNWMQYNSPKITLLKY